MDKLETKLRLLKETLEKAIALPSPKGPKVPTAPSVGNLSKDPTKMPSLAPNSKKNPVKQAEQVEDPHAKAQELYNAKEKLKLSKNGQWSLDKTISIPTAP